jgi:hypothetical protein
MPDMTNAGPTGLEELVAEIQAADTPSRAATMGRIAKLRYSHEAMIDLLITHPGISQNTLALHFGYTPSWVSNIMASDAFQAKLAERRKEVIDPTVIATVEERIRGLTIQSLTVLREALEKPAVKPEVALRAFELGAKAMGLGGHAPPAPTPVDLDALAQRLVALNPAGPRIVEGEVLSKETSNG